MNLDDLTEEELHELARGGVFEEKRMVALHPNAHPATLLFLSRQGFWSEIDQNPMLHLYVEIQDGTAMMTLGVIAEKTDDLNRLGELALFNSCPVLNGVASNPRATPEMLVELVKSSYQTVLALVGSHKNTPESVLNNLSNSSDWIVRMQVASNKNASTEIIRKLSKDKEKGVAEVAKDEMKSREHRELAEKFMYQQRIENAESAQGLREVFGELLLKNILPGNSPGVWSKFLESPHLDVDLVADIRDEYNSSEKQGGIDGKKSVINAPQVFLSNPMIPIWIESDDLSRSTNWHGAISAFLYAWLHQILSEHPMKKKFLGGIPWEKMHGVVAAFEARFGQYPCNGSNSYLYGSGVKGNYAFENFEGVMAAVWDRRTPLIPFVVLVRSVLDRLLPDGASIKMPLDWMLEDRLASHMACPILLGSSPKPAPLELGKSQLVKVPRSHGATTTGGEDGGGGGDDGVSASDGSGGSSGAGKKFVAFLAGGLLGGASAMAADRIWFPKR